MNVSNELHMDAQIEQATPSMAKQAGNATKSLLGLILILLSGLAFALSGVTAPASDAERSVPTDGGGAIRRTRTPTPTSTATPTPTRRRNNNVPGGGLPIPTPRPTVEISVVVDIDVDSDNNGAIDGSESEDAIEMEMPGKLMVAHELDSDYDGIPDFADGIRDCADLAGATTWDSSPAGSAGVEFTPMRVRIVEWHGYLPRDTTARFECSHEDKLAPHAIEVIPDTDHEAGFFRHGGGVYRLWAKDGTQERSALPFHTGAGDLIHCDEEIPLSTLRRLLGADLSGNIYIESLGNFSQEISLRLFIPSRDEDGRDVVIMDESELSDQLRISSLKATIEDVQSWRPTWTGSTSPSLYGQGQLTFPSLNGPITDWGDVAGSDTVGGAVTDGSAVVLVRVRDWDSGVSDLEQRLSLRVDPAPDQGQASSEDVDLPNVFGGFQSIGTPEGNLVFPSVPMPRYIPAASGWHRERRLEHTGLFYAPPRNFITQSSVISNSILPGNYLTRDPSAEVAQVGFKVIYQPGISPQTRQIIGSIPFRLRRPPLVVVHGLNGRGGSGYWDMSVWDEYNPQLATRLYYVDYSSGQYRNYFGYAENMPALAQKITAVLESYRLARDETVAGGASPGDRHIPERSFRRQRMAISKVDVVGHSMGGQVTRTFISNVSGAHARQDGHNWTLMTFSRAGEREYFNAQNLGTGAIRRFIPLGSPFRGSPIATNLEPYVYPNSASLRAFGAAAVASPSFVGEVLVQMGIFERRNGTFVATNPTALADLAENSPAQRLLENANYPTGDKAVMWFPIVGYVELARQPIHDANGEIIEVPDGAGLAWDLIQCAEEANAGAALLEFFNRPYPRSLRSQVSDYVVPSFSQRNVMVRTDSPDEEEQREGTPGNNYKIGVTLRRTVHSSSMLDYTPFCSEDRRSIGEIFNDYGIVSETNSALVGEKVGQVLIADDALPEGEPTDLNRAGIGGLQSTGLGAPVG